MAISALDVGERAEALAQLMRSEEPLDRAHEIMDGVAAEDRAAVLQAFAARGWEDGGEPVPARGARIRDQFQDPFQDPLAGSRVAP